MVWSTAYVCFLVVSDRGPAPAAAEWRGVSRLGLRFLYEADPPYNCFPSLHVAHSFVSALTCSRVHRGSDSPQVSVPCSSESPRCMPSSTTFSTSSLGLAWPAWPMSSSCATILPTKIPTIERRVAPVLALCVVGIVCVGIACYWVAYRLSGAA